VTFPTDSKLLYKAVVKLVKAAQSCGIRLRQSYVRVGKKAAVKASRYAHAKQCKRMRRQLRKLLRRFFFAMIRWLEGLLRVELSASKYRHRTPSLSFAQMCVA